VLENDTDENDFSENLTSVGVLCTMNALQSVKSCILAQENVNDDIVYFINFCSLSKRSSMKKVKITDFLK
jgi:hypothetical protein